VKVHILQYLKLSGLVLELVQPLRLIALVLDQLLLLT